SCFDHFGEDEQAYGYAAGFDISQSCREEVVLRDLHMAETLHALSAHLDSRFGRGKIVVWAHNSHLGNARATDRSKYGEWNLGQLVRERYAQSVPKTEPSSVEAFGQTATTRGRSD